MAANKKVGGLTIEQKFNQLTTDQQNLVLRDRNWTLEEWGKFKPEDLTPDERLRVSVAWYHSHGQNPTPRGGPSMKQVQDSFRETVRRTPEAKQPATKKAKPMSRAARWSQACSDAKAALEVLEELRGEYESWKDNLPENLQGSPLGEKLETVVDFDIQSAIDLVDECEGADLPLGFGRD